MIILHNENQQPPAAAAEEVVIDLTSNRYLRFIYNEQLLRRKINKLRQCALFSENIQTERDQSI